MDVFVLVVLLILVFFLIIAGMLGAVKGILDSKRANARKEKIANGTLIVKRLTDEEFVLASFRREAPVQQVVAPVVAPVQTVVATEAVAVEEGDDENVVQIALTHEESKSHVEKYAGLSKESKEYYDNFIKYVESADAITVKETKYKVTYRKLAKKVFDISIKRDVPVIAFYQLNNELDSIMAASGAKKVKLTRIARKLRNAEEVESAKQLFDALCKLIEASTTKGRKK